MHLLKGTILFVAGFCLLLASGPIAPVWQKAFSEWTDKDAQQIMTDSPWARKMPMPVAARPDIAILEQGSNGAPPPSAALGNPANTTTGTNMTVSANPGSPGPADQNGLHTTLPTVQTPSTVAPNVPAPEPASISIIWASATPVRLAVLKLQSGPNTPASGEIERVSKPRENYVIAVAGLAPPDADTDLSGLARQSSLGVRGKPVAVATNCHYRRIGNADVYFFRFPKTALPITADDHQVEFKARFGQAEIKHKFDLREMQYDGQLAL